MSTKAPVADFDSASAMLRATSSFLHGKDFPALGQQRILEPLAMAANLLPRRLRQQVYIAGGVLEATSPRRIDRISAEALGEWAVGMYPKRQYPALAIGSSNGALVHLWAALGIPWLPQTALIPVRQPVDPDDPGEALEIGREPGRVLLDRNPELQLHHMHDANQDRLMVRGMTYYRVKRRRLGEAYRRFIEESLAPGGTLFVVDCELDWGVTTVGDRHYFQHGALGGATEEEFHHGSERVEALLDEHDAGKRRWDGPRPDRRAPEAEWGFEPALLDDLAELAARRGVHIRRIRFPEPESTSPLVADLYRWWYRRRRIPANRLVAESFVLMEPWWVLRTGSIPFWMVFNMEPSRQALLEHIDRAGPFDDIHLMLFSHGIEAVGLPSAEEWSAVLREARRHGTLAGVDPTAFPADFAAFARYHHAVKAIPARYPLPAPLTLAQLDAFLADHGDAYDVRWEDGIGHRQQAGAA